MRLKILSPEQEIFQGEVTSVTLPGTRGYLQVLEHHAPLVSLIGQGQLKYLPRGQEEQHLDVRTGTVEVKDNLVTVLLPHAHANENPTQH